MTTAIYKGTINDSTKFPEPSRIYGSRHWAFKRLLPASLIPMIGAVAATSASPYPILDGVLALSLVVHSHIGVSLEVSWTAFLTGFISNWLDSDQNSSMLSLPTTCINASSRSRVLS
jgi:hypothetical protein